MEEVYDFEELDSAMLEELGLTKEDLLELAIAQGREQFGVVEDNKFWYGFNNGLGMVVTYDDGIYSVDIFDDAGEVHVGRFQTFDGMLDGITMICQDNFEDKEEQDSFIQSLYMKCASFDERIEDEVDIMDTWNVMG